MGLCCSCLEDNTRPYRETPPSSFVHVDQPRRPQQPPVWQQEHFANHFPEPVRTYSSSTVQIVQQPRRAAPQPSIANSRNLLINQQVTIVEVQNCDACGKSDHMTAVCRYRERLCFYCRKEGHIIAVCPAKKRQQQKRRQQQIAQRQRRHPKNRH